MFQAPHDRDNDNGSFHEKPDSRASYLSVIKTQLSINTFFLSNPPSIGFDASQRDQKLQSIVDSLTPQERLKLKEDLIKIMLKDERRFYVAGDYLQGPRYAQELSGVLGSTELSFDFRKFVTDKFLQILNKKEREWNDMLDLCVLNFFIETEFYDHHYDEIKKFIAEELFKNPFRLLELSQEPPFSYFTDECSIEEDLMEDVRNASRNMLLGAAGPANIIAENMVVCEESGSSIVDYIYRDSVPNSIIKLVTLFECQGLLYEKKFLDSLSKRFDFLLDYFDPHDPFMALLELNHTLSLLPRENDAVFSFTKDAEVIFDRVKPLVQEKLDLAWRSDIRQSSDLCALTQIVINFSDQEQLSNTGNLVALGMSLKGYLIRAESSADVHIIAKLLRQFSPESREVILDKIKEAAESMLDYEIRRFNRKLTNLSDSSECFTKLPSVVNKVPGFIGVGALYNLRKKIERTAETLNLETWNLSDFPAAFLRIAKNYTTFLRVGDRTDFTYTQKLNGYCISPISWNKALDNAVRLKSEGRPRSAAAAAKNLQKALNQANVSLIGPTRISNSLHLRAVTSSDTNSIRRYYNKCLAFTIYQLGLFNESLESVLNSYAAYLDQINKTKAANKLRGICEMILDEINGDFDGAPIEEITIKRKKVIDGFRDFPLAETGLDSRLFDQLVLCAPDFQTADITSL